LSMEVFVTNDKEKIPNPIPHTINDMRIGIP